MKESILNRQIKNSASWGFKIPDGAMTKLCFDGFGVYKGKAIYWEAKYLPKPKSFNFNRLEAHQIKALLDIEKLNMENNFAPLLLIGVNYGHAQVRVYYYKDMAEIDKRKRNKNNILKKEFDISTNYVVVKKGLIDFDEILNGE